MFESIIRFGTSEEVKLLTHNADELKIEILAFKPSIIDGIYIPEAAIKEHARFLFGRPVTAGPVNGRAGSGNAVGQIDEMPRVLDNGQIVCKATLWPGKLSQDQLEAIKSSRQVQAQCAFSMSTEPQEGSWQGMKYHSRASGIEWDSVALEIPYVKGHAAAKINDLSKITDEWERRLGRKC